MSANQTSMDDVKAYISVIENRVLNYRDISVMRYSGRLDNHIPARDYAAGYVVRFVHDNVHEGYVLFHDEQFGKNRKLAFLIDDGNKVRPFYLSGWNESGGYFMLHPFPAGIEFGPRKLYHIEVKPN